jgi:RNA polymerase-binding transcription factor DksA
MQAATMNHKIADAREALKRVEDVIVNEIWNNEKFKNDKARNEQKHLARINDERFITGQEAIRQLELQKADLHGMILVTQNELTITTLMYQAALLGSSGGTFGTGGFGIKEVVEMTPGADTVEVPEIKQRMASELLDHSTGLSEDAKATLLNDYAPTLQEPAKTSLRDQLKASMSPEKLAELENAEPAELSDADKVRLIEGYVACTHCGKAIYTPTDSVVTVDGKKFCSISHSEHYAQDNAPYLKPSGNKPTEKIGGIRI